MKDYKITYHPMYPHIDEIKITNSHKESITLSSFQLLNVNQGLPLKDAWKQDFLSEMQKAGVWFKL